MRRHSTATLMGLTKKELVEYVRMAEHNQDVAEETLNQQAENVKDWMPVVHGHWKYGTRAAVCSACGLERDLDDNFGAAIACPNCGAKMDGERRTDDQRTG